MIWKRGFVRGSGLERGALASTVAHDAHNIIVVGKNVADMATDDGPMNDRTEV